MGNSLMTPLKNYFNPSVRVHKPDDVPPLLNTLQQFHILSIPSSYVEVLTSSTPKCDLIGK